VYVSCSTLVCPKPTYPELEDAADKIAELGFGAMDVGVFHDWQHVSPIEVAADPDAWVRRLNAILAQTGLRVSSFNCGLSANLSAPDFRDREQPQREFVALLKLAESCGCPNITLQPGALIEGHTPHELREALLANLSHLGELADGSDVSLGLENHAQTAVEKTEDALDVIRRLWPAVGCTYDPSHLTMQDIPLPEAEHLLDYAVHVHVRNASSGNMQDTMQAGAVEFEWLVTALGRRGYEGALSIEYFSGFDPEFSSVMALRDRLVACGVSATPA